MHVKDATHTSGAGIHKHINTYMSTYTYMSIYIHIHILKAAHTHTHTHTHNTFPTHFYYYGVASSSRLLKIIGLFCKRAL